MQTFRARVTVGAKWIEVTVQARNVFDAKALLEAQYGRGNVSGVSRA